MVYSMKNEYGLKDLSVNELVDLSNRFEVIFIFKNDEVLRKKYVVNHVSGVVSPDIDVSTNGNNFF